MTTTPDESNPHDEMLPEYDFCAMQGAVRGKFAKRYAELGESNINWRMPWHPIPNGTPDDALARELYSELCPRHVLYGFRARPLARRRDCDDVLFELLDDSGRYAIVHLTFVTHPESDPSWPVTRILDGWPAFLRTMESDAAEWSE